MKRLVAAVKHAFAVGSSGPVEPTPDQQVPVDWVCKQLSKRHLTTPGLVAMEVMRPLNFVAAQGLFYLEPAMWALAPRDAMAHYRNFATFLEKRGSLPYMCGRLEEMEQEHDRIEREAEEDAHGDD